MILWSLCIPVSLRISLPTTQAEQLARERLTATFAPQLDARSAHLADEARARHQHASAASSHPQQRSRSASRTRRGTHDDDDDDGVNVATNVPKAVRSSSPPPPATAIGEHAARRRMARVVAAQLADDRQGCTFAPATNARSRAMVAQSALFKQAPSFLERQQTFGELRAMRLEHLQRAEDEAAACTFRPALAPVTERLVQAQLGGNGDGASTETAAEVCVCV